MRRAFPLLLSVVFSLVVRTDAGVYRSTVRCNNPIEENFCVQGETSEPNPGDRHPVNAFGVVHPLGFDGTPGVSVITIAICVKPDSSDLIGSTQNAISIWNALTPTTGKCRHCIVHEDEGCPTAPFLFHAGSTILHELGHCAMGLGHTDLEYDPPGGPDAREPTSFTMSYDGSSVGTDAGPDNIRGSFDDIQQRPLGEIPVSVHWFRRSDNNPVIVDSTMIDITTYSRSIPNLPSGHSWAANANRVVAESLGFNDTQSVMYSSAARLQRFEGLTSDDVSMVKMGMTGLDRMAGTADDYTINLVYSPTCMGADIEVGFSDAPLEGTLGFCSAGLGLSVEGVNPMIAQHYSVVKPLGFSFLFVELDVDTPWDFKTEIFYDGFESGDLGGWTSVLP